MRRYRKKVFRRMLPRFDPWKKIRKDVAHRAIFGSGTFEPAAFLEALKRQGKGGK